MKKLLLMVLLLTGLLPAVAQTGPLPAWELVTPRAHFWFLGSIHLGSDDFYPLDPRLEAAFAQAENLVVEVNIKKLDQSALFAAIRQKGTLPKGQTLDSLVKPEHKALLEEKLAPLGLTWPMVRQFRPWLVSLFLVTAAASEQGLTPAQGIDLHFLDQAEKQSKPVLELETMELQLNVLAAQDDKLALADLAESLDKPETIDRLTEMARLWKTANLAGLWDLLHPADSTPEAKRFEQALLDERNPAWVDQIAAWEKAGGTYFVVGGAGHFLGPSSVLELLKARGLEPKQMGTPAKN